MVFDVKMEDIKHKARLVARVHMAKALATIMYASVVSRKKVRIALMIAALNDLEVSWATSPMLLFRHQLQKRCQSLWVLSLVKTPDRLQ